MKIATGWLGWSEEQALDADMNTIVLAYTGKTEMLKAIFGSTDDNRPSKSKPKPTAKQVKNFAKTHNAVVKATKKKGK